MIRNYSDFCTELLKKGFSQFGGSRDSVIHLIQYGWGAEPVGSEYLNWHSGNLDTDPWEWRIRVLTERNDIAYSKVFFRKAGYITKEWYPYFLAVRRGQQSFDDAYADGTISSAAKRLYEVLREYGKLPVHIIKSIGEFGTSEKSKFESAVTELQMRLFITMCGEQRKLALTGEEYGWPSAIFCTTERFWGEAVCSW
jgi:hypothetical protein